MYTILLRCSIGPAKKPPPEAQPPSFVSQCPVCPHWMERLAWAVWVVWPALGRTVHWGERLAIACHLSPTLMLVLITSSPLANAPSLGTRSMCNRHKRREICTKNASWSHNGTRKSVWCERQFTLAAKRSFCLPSVWNPPAIRQNKAGFRCQDPALRRREHPTLLCLKFTPSAKTGQLPVSGSRSETQGARCCPLHQSCSHSDKSKKLEEKKPKGLGKGHSISGIPISMNSSYS